MSQIVLMFIGALGAVINGVVLLVLFFGQLYRKGTSNAFICNQTVMDLISCIVLMATMARQKTSGAYTDFRVGGWIMCYLFDQNTLLVAMAYAANFWLVVITAERYFKIVHPISHRNRFRPWMVKVGILIPWLDGFVANMIPKWIAIKINASEKCITAYPSLIYARSYYIFIFLWQVVMPTGVFLVCYYKIVCVILRQNKVSEAPVPHQLIHVGPSPTVHTTGHPPTGLHEQLSPRGKKIIKTTLTVTACFFVCWCPVQLFSTLAQFQSFTNKSYITQYLTFLGYVNVVINPVIYSAHLDVVSRTRRALGNLCGYGDHSGSGTTAATAATSGFNRLKAGMTGIGNNINTRF